MADEKWSGFPLEVDTTGVRVMVLYPDGATGTGYKNAQIAIADFFSTIQAQIDDNDTDIIDHENRITDLEDFTSIVRRSSDNAAFQETQPANSYVTIIGFLNETGSPVVKVGTTAGGDDIIPETTVTTENRNDILSYTDNSRTLHFTVTGGEVATTIKYEKNFYEI
jgi:hypothetical protein